VSPGRSRRTLLAAAMAAGAVVCHAESARADRPLAPGQQDTDWYGWQNALVDAGEISIVIVAAVRRSPALGWAGGVGSIFGSSLVHVAHHNFDGALGSAGVRGVVLALAFGGGTFVAQFSTCDPNANAYAVSQCTSRAQLVSYGVGIGLAALADDILFARARRTGTKAMLFPSGRMLPSTGGPSGYAFGVSGVF
jgi:hypothetical protein